MMRRIRDCVECINIVLLTSENCAVPRLVHSEVSLINEILICLKPFVDATEELGVERFVSVSFIIPSIGILLKQLHTAKNEVKLAASQTLIAGLIRRAEERLAVYEIRTISV